MFNLSPDNVHIHCRVPELNHLSPDVYLPGSKTPALEQE